MLGYDITSVWTTSCITAPTRERKESLYLSPNYVSKLLEPAKRPLAGPSSIERIIGAEICALFLWSVHSVMLDVV